MVSTVVSAIKAMGISMEDRPDVAETLQAHNIPLDSINEIIFSHWHFDHVGDATRFPKACNIVVGPGFKDTLLPGYPTNPDSLINEDAFEGRALKELSFEKSHLRIAGLSAIDYFCDGSLYILDTPGHAVGHISALARTTLGDAAKGTEDSFVLLAGDVCHHAGELRPTPSHPLPDTLTASWSLKDDFKSAAEYRNIHPCHCNTQPFYKPAAGGFNLDAELMQATVRKVALLDADSSVFTLLAHDTWLLDVVDLFPAKVNDWKEKGWAEKCQWRFLQDFC